MSYADAKEYLNKYPHLIDDYEFKEHEFKDYINTYPDVLMDRSFQWYRKGDMNKYILQDWMNIHRGTHQYYSVMNSEYLQLLDIKNLKKELRLIVRLAMSGCKRSEDFIKYYNLLINNTKFKDFTVAQNEYLRKILINFEEKDTTSSYIKEWILSYDFVNHGHINNLGSTAINAYIQYMNKLHKCILNDNVKSERCEKFIKDIFMHQFVHSENRAIVYEIIRRFKLEQYNDIVQNRISDHCLRMVEPVYIRLEDVRYDQIEHFLKAMSKQYSYSMVKHLFNGHANYLKYKLL